MKCPRRNEAFAAVSAYPQEDEWRGSEGARTCSYCGSLHPDDFFHQVEVQGARLTPTDKNYKVYVAGHSKFYFQHLDSDGKQKFIELHNDKRLNIGEPGYFYVDPFFCRREKT